MYRVPVQLLLHAHYEVRFVNSEFVEEVVRGMYTGTELCPVRNSQVGSYYAPYLHFQCTDGTKQVPVSRIFLVTEHV